MISGVDEGRKNAALVRKGGLASVDPARGDPGRLSARRASHQLAGAATRRHDAGHQPRCAVPSGRPLHALRAVHVLYERCGGPLRVAETLLARGARADLRELVIIVDDDEKTIDPARVAALRARKFPVALLSTKAVAERLHVVAVPLLMIVDAGDRIRYAGGYTTRRDKPRHRRRARDRRGDRGPPARAPAHLRLRGRRQPAKNARSAATQVLNEPKDCRR